jgi:hypothetical protein
VRVWVGRCRRAGVIHLDRRVLVMPASVRMSKPCLCRPRSMTATETVRNADLYQIADIVALVATGNRQIKRFPAIWSEKEERGHSRGEAEASGGCGGELQCVARRRVCLYWRQNQRLPTLSVCSKAPPDVRDGASLDLEPVGGDPSRRQDGSGSRRASRASDLTQGKPQFFS